MRVFMMAILMFGAVSACTKPKPQSVENATVRLSAVTGNPSAAYFTLTPSAVDDRLMSVSSPLVIRAEMHDMMMSQGMMKMTPLSDGVAVKAGSALTFASGGKHVMLFDVSPKVTPGGTMPITLTFASGATIEALASVKAAGEE